MTAHGNTSRAGARVLPEQLRTLIRHRGEELAGHEVSPFHETTRAR